MLGRSVPYLLVRSENVNAFIRKDTVEIKKKENTIQIVQNHRIILIMEWTLTFK